MISFLCSFYRFKTLFFFLRFNICLEENKYFSSTRDFFLEISGNYVRMRVADLTNIC